MNIPFTLLLSRLILLVLISVYIGIPAKAQNSNSPPQTTESAGVNGSITEEAVRAEYDKWAAIMGDKEYRVSHIMVTNRDAGMQIIERLAKGESFEELAKVYSTDKGSAVRGGDLGWNVPAYFTPRFAAALKETPVNTYSQVPVMTEFGWHIIKVYEVRQYSVPPFEEAKEAIRKKMINKK